MRLTPVSLPSLLAACSSFEVFNLRLFLDAETGEIFEVAEDLVDYCKGRREGTDLQLSDSHELPRAQAVAEEEIALEKGFDEDGLPFDDEDQRFFEMPRLGGSPAEEIREALLRWLKKHNLEASLGPQDSI